PCLRTRVGEGVAGLHLSDDARPERILVRLIQARRADALREDDGLSLGVPLVCRLALGGIDLLAGLLVVWLPLEEGVGQLAVALGHAGDRLLERLHGGVRAFQVVLGVRDAARIVRRACRAVARAAAGAAHRRVAAVEATRHGRGRRLGERPADAQQEDAA